LNDPLGVKHTFEICIYYGTKKPEDFNEFLVITCSIDHLSRSIEYYINHSLLQEDAVNEATKLYFQGFEVCGKVVFVRVIGLLADAAAHAECAYTVPHNAKNGCTKCMVKGVNVVASNERRGRTTFPDINVTRRTDASFRNRTQAAHRNMGRSVIENLPGFYMVKS